MYISLILFMSSVCHGPEVTFTYVGQIFNQGINLFSVLWPTNSVVPLCLGFLEKGVAVLYCP